MIHIRWNVPGFPEEVTAADAEAAIIASWPSVWTHPVTGEPVVDVMEARESIVWAVKNGPCPEFEHDHWADDNEFLRTLVGCGAVDSIALVP